jgi:hypothetical protein
VIYFSLIVSHQDAGAGFKCGIFVHEIEEKEFIERQATQLGNCVNLINEVFMFELVFSVPLHSLEESFWDDEDVKKLYHTSEIVLIVFDDGCPPYQRRIIDIDLVCEWGVGVNRSKVRNNSGGDDS